MTRREAVKFVIIRSLGNFLVLFALYGVCATFGPALMYEAQYRIIQVRGLEFSVASNDSRHCESFDSAQDKLGARQSPEEDCFVANAPRNDENSSGFAGNQSDTGFAQILAGDKEQILLAKDTEFSISIPKIGVSAKIYPNVDPTNPTEFLDILQKGIAHAKGTVFPGMEGNVYLFAHSADNWWNVGRYNAVFYLLQHLELGDEIVVFFDGKRYEYVVSQTLIASPEDVTLLTQAQEGEERLVLQTCWPPGTTWKRLYVIAVPKEK